MLRWLRLGFMVGQLADALALDVNHTVDRTTLSTLLKRLARDAKARIAETRTASRRAACAILRDAARRQAALDTPRHLFTPQHLVIDHLRHTTTQPPAPPGGADALVDQAQKLIDGRPPITGKRSRRQLSRSSSELGGRRGKAPAAGADKSRSMWASISRSASYT